jgi:hypothetical protein
VFPFFSLDACATSALKAGPFSAFQMHDLEQYFASPRFLLGAKTVAQTAQGRGAFGARVRLASSKHFFEQYFGCLHGFVWKTAEQCAQE